MFTALLERRTTWQAFPVSFAFFSEQLFSGISAHVFLSENMGCLLGFMCKSSDLFHQGGSILFAFNS